VTPNYGDLSCRCSRAGGKPFINGMVQQGPFSDADYSLARDCRVLVNMVGEQSERFTIVTNWKAGLVK
jgi:hypothetical protein